MKQVFLSWKGINSYVEISFSLQFITLLRLQVQRITPLNEKSDVMKNRSNFGTNYDDVRV